MGFIKRVLKDMTTRPQKVVEKEKKEKERKQLRYDIKKATGR